MGKEPLKVVLDTNILVSAVTNAGIPREILFSVFNNVFQAIISPTIIVELLEVLSKKFKLDSETLETIELRIKETFTLVYPTIVITVQKDDPDNRIIEAAIEGNCQLIVTGDKELLKLIKYKKIQIITPRDFIQLLRSYSE